LRPRCGRPPPKPTRSSARPAPPATRRPIDACNKIIALKVFSGEKLAAIYFWRAVGWNKNGDYISVIADTTEALRLQGGQIALDGEDANNPFSAALSRHIGMLTRVRAKSSPRPKTSRCRGRIRPCSARSIWWRSE
jgi:hypothetical protein